MILNVIDILQNHAAEQSIRMCFGLVFQGAFITCKL